jgi:hypothetical protein
VSTAQARPTPAPARGKLRLVAADPNAVLCVLVRCHTLVVAVPARLVLRMALADEVATTRASNGALLARSGDAVLPAWDLGALLGLSSPTAAWLFLSVDGGAQPVSLALATGRCLAVRPLPAPTPLPSGLFKKHSDAVVGAFRVDDTLRSQGAGIVGVWLDPLRLLGATAITTAAAAAAATARGPR